jgi:membrane complex biogenesis BtpA family protein
VNGIARPAERATGPAFLASLRLPVLACLHLDALPGSARAGRGGFERVVDHALADAGTLVEAGVDAILIQNNGDAPTSLETQPETIAYMTRIGTEIRRAWTVPLGINILPNGTSGALAVASAVGADFVRIKVYVGAVVGSSGVIQGSAHEAQTFVRKVDAGSIAIAADVYDRSNGQLGDLPLDEAAWQAARLGGAHALVLTALDLGEAIERSAIVRRRNLGVPLYIGGGTNVANVAAMFRHFDGTIVGHSLKAPDGRVDGSIVRAYMDAAAAGRP